MKEQVTKFNLEAAFKALNEIEIPDVGGIKPNKDDKKELRESFRPTPHTDCLLEDYYDVNNQEDLSVAQEDRAEEVAQAKLTKIQKIVDLDAETPEDVQPSYVGKTIVQCPQCMTLFYRNPEDLNVSEEDNTLVNVGEACPNCNNDSGYTVIGKVAEETPVEQEVPAEEGELDLNFEEPVPEEGTEEIPEASENEEIPAEGEEEVNLEPVEEPAPEENKEEEKPEEEEEKKEESFEAHSENILAEQVENALKEEIKEDEHKEEICPECGKNPCECKKEECEECKESLEEDINSAELTKKLDEHNEYIKVLQDEIKSEELAIKNAKNDFIKKLHEKNLESLKAALDEAIPAEVKAETAVEELPTPEDAGEEMSKNEAVEENKPEEPLKEAEDAVAKDAPEEGDKVELKQQAVSEIHKGKEEHVPGAVVDQEINESLNEEHVMDRKEFEARAEELGIEEPKHESCENCEEKEIKEEQPLVEGDIKLEDSDAAVEKMLDSKEFETPVTKAEVEEIFAEAEPENDFKKLESVEDIKDEAIEECITESLTNVYENVDSFNLTNCELVDNKFIVEGDIKFKSGNIRNTKYVFTEAKVQDNHMVIFTGLNEDLSKDGKFTLVCLSESDGSLLIAESLDYKYNIGENLVEGLAESK